MSEPLQKLKTAILERAEFHRTTNYDPHGTSTAVYIALIEIGTAIAQALEDPTIEPPTKP